MIIQDAHSDRVHTTNIPVYDVLEPEVRYVWYFPMTRPKKSFMTSAPTLLDFPALP